MCLFFALQYCGSITVLWVVFTDNTVWLFVSIIDLDHYKAWQTMGAK